MKNKWSGLQIAVWALAAVPVLMAAAVYGKLPELIPTNWGLDNQVSYGSKTNIWIIAGMAPLFGALFSFPPKIDPRKRNYEKFMNPYLIFQIVMQLILIAVTGIIIVESFRPGTVDVDTVVCALCAILFIVIGLLMPKFQQNYFCGFKTPWTLSSETVWIKTNSLGGRMLFGAGIIAFAGAFLPAEKWKMAALLLPLAAAVFVPMVMSYIWFQKETGK